MLRVVIKNTEIKIYKWNNYFLKTRLSGLSPFMGDNDGETYNNITKAEYDFDDESFNDISDEAKDFINQLLVKDLK